MFSNYSTQPTVTIAGIIVDPQSISYPGSFKNSWANAGGEAKISRVILTGQLEGTYRYYIWDELGEKDRFDDPVVVTEGPALSQLNAITDKPEVVTNELVNCNADPFDGSMKITVKIVSLDPFNEMEYLVVIPNVTTLEEVIYPPEIGGVVASAQVEYPASVPQSAAAALEVEGTAPVYYSAAGVEESGSISITSIEIDGAAQTKNVQINVELNNANHWHYVIDQGPEVMVEAYDEGGQLCAGQEDPHEGEVQLLGSWRGAAQGGSEAEKYKEALEEVLDAIEKNPDPLRVGEDLMEARVAPLENAMGDVIEEFGGEEMDAHEEDFQPQADALNEALREAGIDPNRRSPQDILEGIGGGPTVENEREREILESRPDLQRMAEDLLQHPYMVESFRFIDVIGAVFEEILPELEEIVEDLELALDLGMDEEKLKDYAKELAKELLEKLREGELTPKELAKLLSLAPSLGLGGALDQLLYRKGWIPARIPGGYIPPIPGHVLPGLDGLPDVIGAAYSTVCSEPAPCDGTSRAVKLTVLTGGNHTARVIAVDANHQHLVIAEMDFIIPIDEAPGAAAAAAEAAQAQAAAAAAQAQADAAAAQAQAAAVAAQAQADADVKAAAAEAAAEAAAAMIAAAAAAAAAATEAEKIRLAAAASEAEAAAAEAEEEAAEAERIRLAAEVAARAAARAAAATVNIIDDVSSLFTETGTYYVEEGSVDAGACGVCVATAPITGLSIATGGTTTFCSMDSIGIVSRGTVVDQTYTSEGTCGGGCATTENGVVNIAGGTTFSTGSTVHSVNGIVIVKDIEATARTWGGCVTKNKIVGGTTIVTGGEVATYLGHTKITGGEVSICVGGTMDNDWRKLEIAERVTSLVDSGKVIESKTVVESTDCLLPREWDGTKCACPPPKEWDSEKEDCVCPGDLVDDGDGGCYDPDDPCDEGFERWDERCVPKCSEHQLRNEISGDCYYPPCREGFQRNKQGLCERTGIFHTWTTEKTPGCTDDGSDPNFPGRPDWYGPPGAEALNYDGDADFDNGSCDYGYEDNYGCTDDGSDPDFPDRPDWYPEGEEAINYDDKAVTDNGSCDYRYEDPVKGCMDDGDPATNARFEAEEGRPPGYVGAAGGYNEAATVHEPGSCYYDYDPVYGCMDDGTNPNFPGRPAGYVGEAVNYDELAEIDDPNDPCRYLRTNRPGCMDDGSNPNFPGRPAGYRGRAVNYDELAEIHNNTCEYLIINIGDPKPGCMDDGSNPNFPGRPAGFKGSAANYDKDATVPDPNNPCRYPPVQTDIPGCTDPRSLNYNKDATIDDGSCDPPCLFIEKKGESVYSITVEGGTAPTDDVTELFDEDGYPIDDHLDDPIIPTYPPAQEIVAPEEISCDEEECNKDDLTY